MRDKDLEVKMVDGSKCAQAIITKSEVWTTCFCCHVKRKQEALAVNSLGQALKNARNQKHMPIFNRTNLLHQKKSYYNCLQGLSF